MGNRLPPAVVSLCGCVRTFKLAASSFREARCSMYVPRVVLAAVTVALLVGCVAACGAGHDRAEAPPPLHAVPTSSWTPGSPSFTALARGTLESGMVSGTFCVWLAARGGHSPIVWPADYHIRLRPLELLNSQGVVVARGGDQVRFGGGEEPVNPGPACMLNQRLAFYVMSNVTARHQ